MAKPRGGWAHLAGWRLAAPVAAMTTWLLAAAPAQALELQPVGNFEQPVFVTSDPGDEGRIFVVEKEGTITTLVGGQRRTFLDIREDVEPVGEQGLLSMAFDPGFATNGRFYVFYVAEGGGSLEIAEFTVDAGGEQADPGSRRPILSIPHPTNTNHNGGQLQIGPDGLLYISTGDGAVSANAQDITSLLGKVLRIDPDPAAGGARYSVPAGNPFVGVAGRDEIWSYGLRNPWRFSFDRETGAFTLGDVGQQSWEEVNFRPQPPAGDGARGSNFGWPCREGAHPLQACTPPGFVDPVFEYDQTGAPCAITGGYVSRDPGTPAVTGRYLYADLCVGEIRSVNLGDGSTLGATGDRSEGLDVSQPSSFGEDACGRLYVAALGGGTVSRIVGPEPTDCEAIVETPPEEPPPPSDGDRGPCKSSTVLETDGADELRGTSGADGLTGLGGGDILRGLRGGDCLSGGKGKDKLLGGKGGDRLHPDDGRDTVRGGGGGDNIRARDGDRDRLKCGAGFDRVFADRKDLVATSCERVISLTS